MMIQFVDAHGVRRSMRFGRISKKEFEQVRFRVKRLLEFRLSGAPPDRETTAWLSELAPYIRKKLERAELIETPPAQTLSDWIDFHVGKKLRAKESSRFIWGRCKKRLVEKLGDKTLLVKITKGHAADWVEWMHSKFSVNTVRRMTGIAKQFFADAVRHRVIEENPFDGLPTTMIEANDRQVFVDQALSLKVLDACIDQQWRMIFALCRWGGLRCPSEVLALQWGHVNWDQDRLVVMSPKTAHHHGKDFRVIPLFPEIRQELEKGFDMAEEGSQFVITRYRNSTQNLRTTLIRTIVAAGGEAWPKPFHNLRSTRETELASAFPLHVVIKWLGNSKPVAMRSYLQVQEADFARAASLQHCRENATDSTRTVESVNDTTRSANRV